MFFNQMVNIPVNKKNEGILFVGEGIPQSRPLHIYRKTGAHCPTPGQCTIKDKPLKMLGKNSNGVFVPPDRCRNITSAPYYSSYSGYVQRKCMPAMTPMYTVSNLSNKRFHTQGGVSESALLGLKKYEEIIRHNQSLLNEYKINLKYSSDPVVTLKDKIAFSPQENSTDNADYNNYPASRCRYVCSGAKR